MSVGHLAAVQRVCRRLYIITTPYVWQSVDLERLLLLLPGSTCELGKAPKIQMITPSPIADDYFDRFFYYSRFVKCLTIIPQFVISGSFEEDSNEVAVLVKATGHLTLPSLREVKLTMIVENNQRGYRDEYKDYGFWIEALIPRAIEHVSFEAFSNYNETLLQALVDRAPELSHFDFACEVRSSRFYRDIVGPKAMSNVHFLRYSGSIMDPDVLQWLASMPQLQSLELTLDPDDSEDPSVPEIEYETEAFRALTTLRVFTCDHGDVGEQLNLLNQIWRTPLVKCLTCLEVKLSKPIHPGIEEVDNFMNVLISHSPRISNLRIWASSQPEDFPEMGVDFLSDIGQLPILELTLQCSIYVKAGEVLFKYLGVKFVNLEHLDLESTSVEVSDLLNVHNQLPKLHSLRTGVWQTKTDRKRLKRTLLPKIKGLAVRTTDSPCGSSLSVRFRERRAMSGLCAYNLDFCDIDLLAL
ncbi:hypothetical protein RhiLY_11279 [Ceratobasidium sp. AG-Ba]|nr:hypothetical protein RhiLY_04992 [Ceratobasidium sp. AG-Ba]QRW12280.1 hypothetical protein RhiLY_11279 [Ceratobasidium sp. AG-Ba]